MTYSDMVKINNSFWDTIDFNKFIPDDRYIIIRDLMNSIEQYYDEEHPDLLPREFDGFFFNFMNEEDFAHYLKKRYGYKIKSETYEAWYICK